MNITKKINILNVLVWILCFATLAWVATRSFRLAEVGFIFGCVGYFLAGLNKR